MSQNSKNVYFSETKAPQGATRHEGAFEKLPPENKFIFLIKSQMDFSSKNIILVTFYHITTIFFLKTKMTSKNILEVPATIPAQFPYIK